MPVTRRAPGAEETLRALRAGEVDALVATRAGEEHVVMLQGADLPYRVLLDQMDAGAVTLTPDGVVVYCNRRFAEMVRTPPARVVGAAVRRFVPRQEQPTLDALLEQAARGRSRGEFSVRAGTGRPTPVSATFAPLRLAGRPGVTGVIGVIVDITEQKRLESVHSRLVEQAMTAQEEERRRVARELHDETGQSLTALLVGLRTIEESPTTAAAGRVAKRLREVVAVTLRDVGRLSRGLHPGVLEDLGFVAAVTRYLQEFSDLHQIAMEARITGMDDAPLPLLMQSTLYRILQEALTNVAKHGDARNAVVRLVKVGAAVELQVRDDGKGFDPVGDTGAPAGRRHGLGLQGMRERASLLGGSIEVRSRPGDGTTITARLPIRGA